MVAHLYPHEAELPHLMDLRPGELALAVPVIRARAQLLLRELPHCALELRVGLGQA